MIAFGVGSVAQKTLSKGDAGSYFGVNVGWALGVLFGILISKHVSGAHLNPAVTIALAVHKRFSWTFVPFFILAQLLGCFLASATVFGIYFQALQNFDGGSRETTGPVATAAIWATFPQDFLNTAGLTLKLKFEKYFFFNKKKCM